MQENAEVYREAVKPERNGHLAETKSKNKEREMLVNFTQNLNMNLISFA